MRPTLESPYRASGISAARHAGTPEQFVTQVTIRELMYVAHDLQRLPGTAECRRNELEQRFREIGRYESIRKRRTEALRMRRLREITVRSNAQGFLLDTPPPPGDPCVAASLQGAEALLKHLIHDERFTTCEGTRASIRLK
jgi:hypothetical protein